MKKIVSIIGILVLPFVFLTGCTGETVNDALNQSIYKTIDFKSYTGEVDSTEFDDLIDKKVTFTNVPTLGGTLGNMSKGFICSNESSLTIEDDASYTLTGIVTSTTGTFNVTMKDCTLTKN
jgi:hypothetical protein